MLVACILASLSGVSAQEKIPNPDDVVGFHPQLRSVLFDAEWALFMGGISGSVDIDLIRLPSSLHSSFGVRFGVDRYFSGSVGGATAGSPFTDYNILVRHTASGSLLRLDIYLGYSYHTTSYPTYVPSKGGAKFGVEIRWKLVEHIFSLLAKLSRPAGVGGSIGWDR